MDQRTNSATKQIELPFNRPLEGYEFMDLVSGKHALQPRFVKMRSNGKSWMELLGKLHAITFFGQGFGDLYRPTEKVGKNICKDWRTVPPGHEYLSVPVSLLKRIKEYEWREGEVDLNTPEIARGIWWNPHHTTTVVCGPNCEHIITNRVQVLNNKDKNAHDTTCKFLFNSNHCISLY